MSDSSPKFKKDAKKDKMESKQQEKAARLTIYLSIYLTSLRVLVPVGADARGSIPAIFIVGVGRLVLLLPLFGSNSQGRYGSDPFLYPESSECWDPSVCFFQDCPLLEELAEVYVVAFPDMFVC
jgi:hypothetical protein